MAFIIIILSIILFIIYFIFADKFCNNLPTNPMDILFKLNLQPIYRFVL